MIHHNIWQLLEVSFCRSWRGDTSTLIHRPERTATRKEVMPPLWMRCQGLQAYPSSGFRQAWGWMYTVYIYIYVGDEPTACGALVRVLTDVVAHVLTGFVLFKPRYYSFISEKFFISSWQTGMNFIMYSLWSYLQAYVLHNFLIYSIQGTHEFIERSMQKCTYY